MKNVSAFLFNFFLAVVLHLFYSYPTNAQNGSVGIGTVNPNPSAILELSSTEKGFLLPRLTSAQRDAIVSPAEGLILFNTSTGRPNYYYSGNWYEWYGNIIGSIASLNCNLAVHTATLNEGAPASGVSSSVPYTQGNGGTHQGQTITSTGVTGLTAVTPAGSFANGAGSLTYTISGTPASSGTASFALNIGGQSCDLDVSVAPAGLFTCGISTVTFIYNGSQVTYGTVTGANNKCWLDRNLGATQVATSSTDGASFGDLFQWGRLDDGHQMRTSLTTATLSSIDQPAHGNFILAPNSPFDWRSPQNNNLWQGVNGINNPCPSGYRVPTEAELEAERISWSSNDGAGAFASTLKLPMAGYRPANHGLLWNVGTYGMSWSKTVSGAYSRFLYFVNGDARMDSAARGDGFSVRCVKD